MNRKFKKVKYELLNARQQENYNFQKISGLLADYGFITIRLTDDWKGADFLAQHHTGETLRLQLKGRLTFLQKYQGKDLWVCFRDGANWYLYPHDELLKRVLAETNVKNTKSWARSGGYSFPALSKHLRELLNPYLLPA
jgi:hypothetical protein